MPFKKPQINTASEAVRVAEELMDFAMLTGNKQLLSDLILRLTSDITNFLSTDSFVELERILPIQ